MEADYLDRTRLLLGDEAVERLRRSRVLVLGLGGVGGAAAEMIARAGVGRMILIDGDTIEESNRNRQLPALVSTVGRPKAEVVAARLRDINPAIELDCRVEFLRDERIDALLDEPLDYAVDAIDSLSAKAHFLAGCVRRGVPVISSMGSGGRRDPSRIAAADIARTHDCALARAVRQKLRRLGIERGVPVVFSPEPVPPEAIRAGEDATGHFRSTVGTVSYLPTVFGCWCAAAVINGLLSAPAKPEL